MAKQINLPNVYPKEADNFPSAAQFKRILLKAENKNSIKVLVKQRFRVRVVEVQGEVIYCEGKTAENLSTGELDSSFAFKQAEADTMILTSYSTVRDNGYSGDVVIDSEDTDVCVHASHVSKKLPGKLLIKNKNVLYKCQDMLKNKIANIIIPLYEITGAFVMLLENMTCADLYQSISRGKVFQTELYVFPDSGI